jgi:ABC-2 type transport system ATP-binding protein
MRMLTGTLQPDAGEVRYDGRPIGEDLKAAKARVGYLPETNALYQEMLVAEYLEYAATLRGLEGAARRSALSDAVEETGIENVYGRPISQLSKGYRQRVGLAAAILHRPEILVLDEPTEGLDPNQRVGIRHLVSALGRDRTVLLSTHVLGEVEATCSRLLIVHNGRLVADGSVAELLETGLSAPRYVVEAEGDDVPGVLGTMPGVASTRADRVDGRDRVELVAANRQELRPAISRLAAEKGWTLWELHRERASLEQLFQQLTDEAGAEEVAS